MNTKLRFKTANQEEVNLYIFVGEALCMTQHLEDCLSHAIIIKKNSRDIPKIQADVILDKFRTYTLGKAIKIAKDENLFSNNVEQSLEEFLNERNWLVHRSIAHNRDDLLVTTKRDSLINRVKEITNKAKSLLHIIEEDLLEYCSVNGADMSKVREAIEQFYSK